MDSKDVYVIGGGQIYKEFLPYCDTAHITKVDYSYEADTYISDLISLKTGELQDRVMNIHILIYVMSL